MLGSTILEVAIGLTLMFSLVSLICAAIREGIESKLKNRAAQLDQGIRDLLQDPSGEGLAASFYTHPIIFALFEGAYWPAGAKAVSAASPPAQINAAANQTLPRVNAFTRGGNLPSYIPSKDFALALLDLTVRGPVRHGTAGATSTPISADSIRANISNLESPAVQRAVLAALDAAEGNLEKTRDNLAAWYDSAMDRVSGRYKRATHGMLFLVGFLVAAALNINTLTVAQTLYTDDALRSAVTKRAEVIALYRPDVDLVSSSQTSGMTDASKTGGASTPSSKPVLGYEQALGELTNQLDLPIGWSAPLYLRSAWTYIKPGRGENGNDRLFSEGSLKGVSKDLGLLLISIVGWLVTAAATTLGAPFWFDVLNRLMVIRSTVKPREKSPEEQSEDRQKPRTDGQVTEAGGGSGGEKTSAPPPPSTTPPLVPPLADSDPDAPDNDNDVCNAGLLEDDTEDEHLPLAEGGVALEDNRPNGQGEVR